MAAEDYIDFSEEIDIESLFEPRSAPYNGIYKGRFYQKGLNNENLEDHHFIGFCEVIRESQKSIYCKFINDEDEQIEQPKVCVRAWSSDIKRWIPRSQIADQTRSKEEQDSLSLNPLSSTGDKGNLWISGWLKDEWDKEGVKI